jgi:hypothetical protein
VRRSPSELQVAWRALGQALADDARAVAFWRRRLRELAKGRREAERAPLGATA